MVQKLILFVQRFCGYFYGLLVIEQKTVKDVPSKFDDKYSNQENIKRYWK